ncbi:MAG: undecaprenyl diphosphate synthase family protein [Bilophila wadsworthia]
MTLYTFSQENWGRPRMKSACSSSCWSASLAKSSPPWAQRHQPARIRRARRPALPARTALRHAMNRTAKCSDMIVNLALNYSGREEILRAAPAHATGRQAGSGTKGVPLMPVFAGQPD